MDWCQVLGFSVQDSPADTAADAATAAAAAAAAAAATAHAAAVQDSPAQLLAAINAEGGLPSFYDKPEQLHSLAAQAGAEPQLTALAVCTPSCYYCLHIAATACISLLLPAYRCYCLHIAATASLFPPPLSTVRT